ncbi:glycosyltransferase family 9 protein [Spirosoma rhododendri]|uniref:glycosyltransferase family 9 protein n=1 Tax=Spirosoma rhododendri TaxID=2728024 RepID=UPI0020C3B790|nr:glycosyltransferase family 9 protein [Spirosoma rhododendri]
MAGQLDLPEFCGLIALAPLLISNNTGPVHIAAAVNTPVVVAYAKTNPQHTPWMVPSKVLYVEVARHLRSRNVLLQRFPEPAAPEATPHRIVEAITNLRQEVADRSPTKPEPSTVSNEPTAPIH